MIIDIPDTAIAWLRNGERGSSSEVIFEHLTGIPIRGWGWKFPPADPSDLERCRRLLDAVPEFSARLPEMAQVSPQWAALVVNWDELCALMDEEAPSGQCPRTYERMIRLRKVQR